MTSSRDSLHPLALRQASPVPLSGPGFQDTSALATRLSSAEQTLRDISHALAHDLRTSLRHVASYAQLLADPGCADQPEQVTRLSVKVIDASRRLQHLMESVSALARLQVADIQPEQIDANAMVRSVLDDLGRGAGGMQVECVIPTDLPPARADAVLLLRVWQELLDNAWRHASGHAQPRIEVSYESVPGGHAYFVHDNGPGFEPGKAAELFGLFQRSAGSPDPGLGVGLAMVRRIVECHGGRVWATARPGAGASFGFSLPADGG
jgi:light-regulated signal transduction histidine kinase (bacteriophytochrome)